MSAGAIIVVVIMAGLTGTVVVLALRQSGLKAAFVKEAFKRTAAENTRDDLAVELITFRKRTSDQLAALRGDISELEDDLENCNTPGAVRTRLERLLSKATDRSGADD